MKTPLTLITFSLALSSSLIAADYYVSAARGKGKSATKEKPAKDLGNIIKKLVPGDTVHIAEGNYVGRGGNGSDVITVPVSLIGGYSDDFSKRDPWGAHRTIFSGENKSKNFDSSTRLLIDLMKYRAKEMPKIVVDGIIIDDGPRNRYSKGEGKVIVRMANPKTGENPTPSQGGLVIRASKTGNFDAGAHWDITVQNCIVMNTAPTQGALTVSGYKDSKIKISNNIVINNTGTAIMAGTKYVGDKAGPDFDISHNTVLFTWKYEPITQSFSGNSFKADNGATVKLTNNVFAFADRAGINNISKAALLLKDNLIAGNVATDYLEFDTKIDLDDIEDEAEYLHDDTGGNVAGDVKPPVSQEWLKLYGARILIDRNAQAADVKVQKTRANELRRILGLPVQGTDVAAPKTNVWLHQLSVDDAVKAGSAKYLGKYGSSLPKG